jgi:3-oxoadipate enol-lactonase
MGMMLSANGISVAYRLEGPEDAPVVTLSHSLATSSAMWEPQATALTTAFRVLAYDARGHGGSDAPPGPYTLPLLVADVRALLVALGIERTFFVGLSMGGMIGQLFALTHPDMVHGLALASTTARMAPDAPAVWDERIAVARSRGMEAHVESTIARWFTPPFIQGRPDVVDPVREQIRRTDPAGYVGCIEAIRHTDLLDRLAGLDLPTLVITGRDDPGLSAAEAIHQRVTGSEMVVLSPAAHLCNLERPEKFNEALLGFLARVRPDCGA